MSAGIVSAEMEWSDGPLRVKRLRAGLDAAGNHALDRAEQALSDDLRRRLGPSYSRADLYESYVSSERWARDVVADAAFPLRLPQAVSPLVDAAYLRARNGARDA